MAAAAACAAVAGDTPWGPAAILFLPTTAILDWEGNRGQETGDGKTKDCSCLAFSHWQPPAARRETGGRGNGALQAGGLLRCSSKRRMGVPRARGLPGNE